MVRGRGESRRAELEPRGRGLWLQILSAGLATVLLTGFFGSAAGWRSFQRWLSCAAVGTSLVMIAITSATALAAHLSTGTINSDRRAQVRRRDRRRSQEPEARADAPRRCGQLLLRARRAGDRSPRGPWRDRAGDRDRGQAGHPGRVAQRTFLSSFS